MTQITATTTDSASAGARVWGWLRGLNPVYLIAVVLLVAVGYLNPVFYQPDSFLTFVARAAPLMILTAGQVFVLVSGGFDLSVGSVVTSTVIISAILANNDPGATWWVILFLLAGGVLIGLINGAVTTYLKVPSLIATLGMLLIVRGVGLFWSGGAPRGYLPDNLRMWGRGGIEGLFGLRQFPYAVILLVIFGIIYWLLLHRLNYGRQLLALGDNPRASRLSGVNVNLMRISAFVICAVSAVVSGIMVAGRGGVSIEAGTGLEMQSIAAAVLGGTMLLGGRGSVPAAMTGALALEVLFTLLNLMGLPKPLRDAVQGLIIISAVAYTAYSTRKSR
ncbi:MAG: ABC transporter permease [Anaerolineae bacterium]|uniref:ABC transporter permease n=1 Tax=Promineifilum sp. TaxID=2664178 RepID=UPI001D3A989E|nr:ABC transporter permease [Anaerolineales bacterium]MCB8935836.1 ABC transporter permease [Promineifilum sp.]MCO5180457.1 ABC transporter permease [Promineifilum sp.]MCW5847387.1 ABC transporter permease [Anaerolineae bacterium]